MPHPEQPPLFRIFFCPMRSLLHPYFPDLPPELPGRFETMVHLYREWNGRINVVSRKDIDHLAVHHILHSLAIARVIRFRPGTTVLDAGTGGGFPGIPLALMFPGTRFTLADSIGKKIKVIDAVAGELQLENVTTVNARFESLRGEYDFVTGRAVSGLPLFVSMVRHLVRKEGFNGIPNGILYLTGGEVEAELKAIRASAATWPLSGFFREEYFATKKLVHLFDFR